MQVKLNFVLDFLSELFVFNLTLNDFEHTLKSFTVIEMLIIC